MASSSAHKKTHKDVNYSSNHSNPFEENERDSLELGLGLGFGNECNKKKQDQELSKLNSGFRSSLSSSLLQAHHKTGLSLGLGFGLGQEMFDDMSGVSVVNVAPASGNYNKLWQEDQNQNDDHYQKDMIGSWPWQVDTDSFVGLLQDCQKPLPYDSHDYYSIARRTRPHSAGLWFTLRSCTNRGGAALPQIPKAYIRVKDENVTIVMVKKYLVAKLGLSNEAEIDIWCMGQNLLHTQTLKHVRDSVWLPGIMESINSTTISLQNNYWLHGSSNHLMSLSYGKRCLCS